MQSIFFHHRTHIPNSDSEGFLNAVKNIIGDDKENPSLKLLDISEKYINRFSVRNDDDQILKKVIKDGFGLTVIGLIPKTRPHRTDTRLVGNRSIQVY